MIYRCHHFRAHELVGPDLYARFGEDCFRYLRVELLRGLDGLWEALNAIRPTTVTVNNWKSGGQFKASGYRVATDTEYKPGSAHSVGAGADCKFSAFTPTEAITLLTLTPGNLGFRRYENPKATPSWAHLDCLSFDGTGMQEVNP